MSRFLVVSVTLLLTFVGALPPSTMPDQTASPSSAIILPGLGWRFDTGSEVVNSPQVVGKMVYVTNAGGSLYAITSATGQQRWRARFGSGHIIQSFTSVADGEVFVADSDGDLLAFDAADGRQLWHRHTTRQDDIFSRPTVAAGIVYVDDLDQGHGNVYAFDAATGRARWQASTGQMQSYPLPVANGLVYVADQTGELTAFDAATGHQRWRAHLGQGPSDYSGSAPVVANDTVYVGTYKSALFAVDAKTGVERWRVVPGGSVSTPITVSNGTVYFGANTTQGGALHALAETSGQERWHFDSSDGFGWAVVADGTVYASSFAHLYAVDAQSGRQHWRFDPGSGSVLTSPAVISGGTVYVGVNSYLSAIDTTIGRVLWYARTGGEVTAAPVAFGHVVYVGSADGFLYSVAATSVSVPARFAPTTSTTAQAETPLTDAQLENLPRAPAFIGLWRLTYRPGARGAIPAFNGPALIYAESGGLRIVRLQSYIGQIERLPAGQTLILPAGASLVAQNDGATPTTVLAAAVMSSGAASLLPSTPGLTAQFLGGGMAAPLPAGHPSGALVKLQRISLTPGTALAPELTLWPEIVAVDAGALDLAVAGGKSTTVHAGEGVLLTGGALRVARAAINEPVVLTIIEFWGDVHIGEGGGGCGGRCLSS